MSSGASCRCQASMEELQVYSDGLVVKMDAYVAGSPKTILLLGTTTTGLGPRTNWSSSRQETAKETDTLPTKKMVTFDPSWECLLCRNSNLSFEMSLFFFNYCV